MKQRTTIVIAVATLLFVLLYQLGKQPFYLEEPRRALVALEMQLNDNFMVPTEFGEYYYNKPPLWNWVILGSAGIFGGINEWSVRFAAVFFFLLTGVILYYSGKQFISKQFGVFSALFYLVSVDFMFYFSMLGEIDLFYAFLMIGMFNLPFLFFHQKKYFLSSIALYTFAAAGVLTKGLPTFIFAASVIGILVFSKKDNWRKLFSWQHIVGIVLFLGIVVGYFAIYSKHADVKPYLANLFFESSDRTVSSKGIGVYLKHFFLFQIDILKNLLPALLLAPVFFVKKVRNEMLKNQYLRYGLVIFGVNILLYLISPGARQRYIYMLYPYLINLFVFGYLTYRKIVQKPSISTLWIAIFVVIAARFVYSEIVYEQRTTSSEAADQKNVGTALATTLGNAPLNLYQSIEFPRSTIFYYTKASKKVSQVTNQLISGNYYFIKAEDLPEQINYTVLYDCNYSNWDQFYVIHINTLP